jgi:hypothetical protein
MKQRNHSVPKLTACSKVIDPTLASNKKFRIMLSSFEIELIRGSPGIGTQLNKNSKIVPGKIYQIS